VDGSRAVRLRLADRRYFIGGSDARVRNAARSSQNTCRATGQLGDIQRQIRHPVLRWMAATEKNRSGK
jgi:hypothetical protein